MNRHVHRFVLLIGVAVMATTSLELRPAQAHSGTAVIDVESSQPVGANALRYVIRLTWSNDGDAALNTTVTAVAIKSDGAPSTPVPMIATDTDGRYTGTVAFAEPGEWTVQFTSVEPPGVLEVAARIAAPATTSTATSTTGSTTTTAPRSPTTRSSAPSATSRPASDSNDSDSDSGFVWFVGIACVVIVAALAGGTLLINRRRR